MTLIGRMKTDWVVCFFFGLAIFLFSNVQSQSLQLNDIRSRFSKAVKSEELCTTLYNEMIEASGTKNAVFNCYLGVVTVSMAKYTFNPFGKLSYFHNGKRLVESAIAQEPNNIELRFLRCTIQEHVPSFLGYSDNLETDKKMILENISQLTMPKLKEAMITYILNSKNFTAIEKQRVSALR